MSFIRVYRVMRAFLRNNFKNKRVLLPLTVSLQAVSLVPSEFVALQTYSPASSGNTSLIFNMATRFLYFKSNTFDELMACKESRQLLTKIHSDF